MYFIDIPGKHLWFLGIRPRRKLVSGEKKNLLGRLGGLQLNYLAHLQGDALAFSRN